SPSRGLSSARTTSTRPIAAFCRKIGRSSTAVGAGPPGSTTTATGGVDSAADRFVAQPARPATRRRRALRAVTSVGPARGVVETVADGGEAQAALLERERVGAGDARGADDELAGDGALAGDPRDLERERLADGAIGQDLAALRLDDGDVAGAQGAEPAAA